MEIIKPRVELLNKEDVVNFFKEVGSFARICYDSSSDPEKVALHCLQSGHMSGMRTVPFKFYIGDVSRAFSHQFVRHSVGVEINQRSQRYVKENEAKYVVPESLHGNLEYTQFMEFCWRTYARLLAKGLPPEDARMVLPNACVTEMNVAITLQAFINMCHERLCSRAQKEFRAVVNLMCDELEEVEPRLIPLFVPKCEYRNGCSEETPCGRHKNKIRIY